MRNALTGIILSILPITAAQAQIDDTHRPPATVRAEVVAIQQPIIYNRFGSHNPHGMVFALKRDLSTSHGTEPGRARLREDLRPRPLVLRANVGDTLEIRFTNLLGPAANENLLEPEADGHCARQGASDASAVNDAPRTVCAAISVVGLPLAEPENNVAKQDAAGCFSDRAETRDEQLKRQGLVSLRPKECRVYRFRPDRPGAHLILSHGAPAGGEGDGGQLTHGLFGVVIVERAGSRWYRSQVTAEVMAAARANIGTGGFLNYEAMQNGVPLLAMARQTSAARQPLELELIHGDLNSISYCPLEERRNPEANRTDHPEHARIARHCANAAMREAAGGGLVSGEWWRANPAHRSFSVVFHDELHTRYAPPFRFLDKDLQPAIQTHLGQWRVGKDGKKEPITGAMLDGVRDGFAINYGASGMGTILLANRLGTGPAASCVECAYEEFFLGSWANGDPALLTDEVKQLYNTADWNDALPQEARRLLNQDVLRGARFYKDDPSNTHHSYIGDRVVFHNLHAGPKETHVFHLHAHQWRAGSGGQGAYRDSQTIAPLQAITYEIDHGGGGNLNLGPGDSIFHCHLYPHFAQGMWGLWRNHDVFEDGARTLPDGIYGPGTDLTNGDNREGAPIPAVVPLPGQAMPPAPIYSANEAEQMPGFPFFMPGEVGRRAPQPPMDRASDDDSGLPRHVARGQGQRHPIDRAPEASPLAEVARVIAEADFRFEISELALHILPENGTARESRAMQFHAGQGSVVSPLRITPSATPIAARRSDRIPGIGQVAFFALPTPDGSTPLAGPSGLPSGVAPFRVNGRDPAPGAPFADPCVRVDDFATPDREYRVSVIKLEMVVNEQGWHDPQAHINVLTELAPYIEDRRRRAAPFYFRAHSGDCITFRHENRVDAALELDDFQVATPTDTIGQHIHLVKFDVLSSDGSANGWNYEDGTFAWQAVCERLRAADTLARRTGGTSREVPEYCKKESTEKLKYQATIQRWYADRTWIPDPLVEAQPATPQDANKRRQFDEVRAQTWCDQDGKQRWRFDGQVYSADCRDATLGTVFTHDHFGPSSIQQHGFYNALLIEPEFTRWFSADGRVMCSAAEEMRGGQAQGCLMPVTVLDLATDDPQFAVWRDIWRPNAQALILHDEGYRARNATRQVGSRQEPQFREFPLAIADFALLYDGRAGNDAASAEIGKQQKRLHDTALHHLAEWRRKYGFPIEPPEAPEAISQHHHNPYLVNYGQDPVPLRIGASQSATENSPLASVSVTGGPAALRASCNWVSPSEQVSPSRQRSGEAGDLARAFDSFCHGDPFAEIFEAYEGETMQIRLIQGAQEVQHVFNLPSLRWQRDPNVSLGQSTGQEVAIRAQRAQADQQRAVPNAAPTNRRESELRDQFYRDLLTSSLVSAQEVGISEHFEFYARGVDAVGRLGATDHFWHFGSADAIWNGAWGLVRVHNGTQGREFRQATLDATCITRAVEAAARGLPMPACFGDDPGAQRPTVRSRLLGMGAARYAMEQRAPENAMRWQRNEVRANTPRVNFLGWSLDRPAPMGQDWTNGLDRTASETHGCPAWVAWYDPETTRWSWKPIKLRSYHVIAEPGGPPVREHNTGRIIDPRPIRFRAVGMWHSDWLGPSSVENPILNPPENAVYRPLAPSPAEEHPLVIRARAGECIHIKLENLLPKDHFSPVPDGEARLPGITSINSVRYVPSEGLLRGANAVSLLPQLLHQTATLSGIRAGINAEAEEAKFREKFAQVAEPGETVQYAWFAGRYITKPPELASPNGRSGYVVGFAEDYGPINLVSGTDPFVQTMHGLVGTLVIHEADAEIPEPSGQDQAGDWARSQIRVALKRYGLDRSYQDAVMAYRDGLNHHWQELSASAFPIPDCRTCGDSYDKGERAAGWGAEPFWARLHETQSLHKTQSLHETEQKLRLVPRRPQENDDPEDTKSRWTDLNEAIFHQDFWRLPMPQTPLITAQRNVELRLHIGHPAGRARQRVFTILGHDYRDGRYTSVPSASNLTSGLPGIQARTCAPDPNLDVLGWYGSPGSSLLGPGRAITALIPCPEAGEWLWRDGPANVFSSGVWGWLQVRP